MTVGLFAITGVLATVAGVIAAMRRLLIVVHVIGDSMQPGLWPGDRVLVRRGRGQLVAGLVIVLRPPPVTRPLVRTSVPQHPVSGLAVPVLPPRTATRKGLITPWVIKRICALPGDTVPEAVRPAVDGAALVPPGALLVLSDNPAGIDSRLWGFVPLGNVLGRVVTKLAR